MILEGVVGRLWTDRVVDMEVYTSSQVSSFDPLGQVWEVVCSPLLDDMMNEY